jgi:hypothetical protein
MPFNFTLSCLLIIATIIQNINASCDNPLAATCDNVRTYDDATCIDSNLMELESVTVDGETYNRCRCKERYAFYDFDQSTCVFGGYHAGTFTINSGGSQSLSAKAVDFLYTSKETGKLMMSASDGLTNTLYEFIDNDITKAVVKESISMQNTGGFYWNTLACNQDKMTCIDGTDRFWHLRYTFNSR